MSYTPVQNRFWSDGWVRQLNALDRYLFLYLLTNGRAGRTGIYELPIDLMAAECGIDEKDLRLSMLNRLEPRIFYKEGWIIIVNYQKHFIGDGPKFWAGVGSAFRELPEKIQVLAKDIGYPTDRLSIPYSRFSNRIEENRIYTSVADAPQDYIVSLENEREAREKKTARYPNARITFSWFPNPEKSWNLNTTELKHGELLFERGEKKVRSALSFYQKNKDHEHIPQILKPSDLERKWNDLIAFAERNSL